MSSREDVYVLESDRVKVEIPAATMALRVHDKDAGCVWSMSEDPFDEVVVERKGVVTKHDLLSSGEVIFRQLGPGALLADYPAQRLQLLFILDRNRLEVQVAPLEENDLFKIKGVVYPRSFVLSRDGDAYLIAPFAQGVLLPGNWPEKVGGDPSGYAGDLWQFDDEERMHTFGELFGVDVEWWSGHRPGYAPALENRLTMPWWGAVERDASFLAVLDEASWADSHLQVAHDPGGPTQYRLHWLPSWGRLSFPRRIAFHFFQGGDYVSLAKTYRTIAQARGKRVTLRQKNEANPKVDRLMGAAATTLHFVSHDLRRQRFNVDMSFAQGAEAVAAFRDRTPGTTLHVGVRGWQQWGHDFQYPDLVPPAPDAGGPVEFDAMATRIQDLGCLFGLAGDNYHDVAVDSPLFDESMLLRYADGTTNRRNFWASGLTSMVCAGVAMKYLRRNFEVGRTDYPPTRGLLETAHPDTYWIGNYISTYECYDSRHPMTRNAYWDAQREIFRYINDRGLLLNNEHPKDWAAPYFYMARTRRAHKGVYGYDRAGEVFAVPVPLWSLVYHDCLITSGDNAMLGMLNGAPPSVEVSEQDGAILGRVRMQARLHRAVGYESMETHRFLTEDHSVQESQFSNGVTVWIDEKQGKCRITGVDGVPEIEAATGES